MSLFRYAELSKEEKIFVVEIDSSSPLQGQAFSAQLCRYPENLLWEISTHIEKRLKSAPKTSLDVGDMVYVTSESTFCRAEVLEVGSHDCLLDLIDFGRMKRFPSGEVYPLDEDLCSKWERVAIHVLLKHDMKVFSNAAAALSCIDVFDIGRIRYFHGTVTDFSERTNDSKLFQVQSYVRTAPQPPVNAKLDPAPNNVDNAASLDSSAVRLRIPQPELGDTERVFVTIDHPDCSLFGVQLARFDIVALEKQCDSYYGTPENCKKPTNVEAGQYVIAPYGSQFCRAVVLEIADGNARIIYTDYGSEATLPTEDLIELHPGPISDHPWAAITCETTDQLVVEDEYTLKIESSYLDEFGVPIFVVAVCTDNAAGADDPNNNKEVKPVQPESEPVQPEPKPVHPLSLLPPLEFSQDEQTLYCLELDDVYLAAQLGQYTVEQVYDTNIRLTKAMQQNARSPTTQACVAPGDLIALENDSNFYRGLVSKVSGDVVWVYQLDFGIVRKASFKDIYALPSEFINCAMIGCRCLVPDDQREKAKNESIVVRNLRKKTQTDFIDIYEFDIVADDDDAVAPSSLANETQPPPLVTDLTSVAKRTEADAEEARSDDNSDRYPKESQQHVELSAPESFHSKVPQLHVEASESRVKVPEADVVKTPQSDAASPGKVSNRSGVEEPQPNVESCDKVPNESGVEEPQPITESRGKVLDKPVVEEPQPNAETRGKVPDESGAKSHSEAQEFGRVEASESSIEICGSQKSRSSAPVEEISAGNAQPCNGQLQTTATESSAHLEETKCRSIASSLEGGCGSLTSRYSVPLHKLKQYLADNVVDGQQVAEVNCCFAEPYSRSSSISLTSDVADFDSKQSRDPEDPFSDMSFDVVVTSIHRATKICVVKRRMLPMAKSIGETLAGRAQCLEPVSLEQVTMGLAVVAKLDTEPPRYRRALVAHYSGRTSEYKLFLVDSGVIVRLPLASLFQLPADLQLTKTPGYATILKLKADDLTYDRRAVAETFSGTLRCSLSYANADEFVPGELCHLATLYNSSGNVVKQLDSKGVIGPWTQRFTTNPLMSPRCNEADYMDAIVVSMQRVDALCYRVVLSLVEIKERLDRVGIDRDQLRNLFVTNVSAAALTFVQSDPSPWKRARVVGRPQPGTYRLFLVDVGVEINQPVLKTFKCPTNLLHIPEAAVDVTIYAKTAFPIDLQDKLVVVKSHWNVNYRTKMPVVELYDHDGTLLLG